MTFIADAAKQQAAPSSWVLDLHEPEEAIRSELFSAERLEQHGESLAQAQRIDAGPSRELAPRVRLNHRVLLRAYRTIGQAAREQRALPPAAEWLLDNLHVIEEQATDIVDYLPQRFYRELPTLADGHLSGYPRVYGVAWAFVAHTDSRFDSDLLSQFVRAYQRVAPLTSGELWALPITLRIVLLENLRRLSVSLVRAQHGREAADHFADEVAERADPGAAMRTLDLAIEPIRQAFVAQLVQRLRYHHPSYNAVIDAIDQALVARGTSVDQLVQSEHVRQTAANLSVRNIITSMRAISAFDWQDFFEEVSLVEACLREHEDYRRMDFLSRDRYRHAVEDLAKRSRRSEVEVARAVITRATAPGSTATGDGRLGDPGHYLIGGGRREFERELGFTPSIAQLARRVYAARPTLSYIGSITVLTAMFLAFPLLLSVRAGVGAMALLWLAALGLLLASDIAVQLLNRLLTAWLAPRHLPRLELRNVPPEWRTFVVVPTLLANEVGVREQIKQLEIHYLANPDGAVHFALLSDWNAADSESVPGDEALLEVARAGIAALNARYSDGEQKFFLFHRRRQWNPLERQWMGWERKRGKLHEFNRLLRGASDTSFISPDGAAIAPPSGVRYVITLDADTRLPLGTVYELIGIAAHPLNRPHFDEQVQRVVQGYSILQPRITPTLPRRQERSLFRRIFSGASGIDPYAGAVSDIYQDLFGEGSYTGKGLYEVDAFERALSGRVPENTLLSHDLFEGAYARCALVSDVEVFEDFPSHSEVAALRAHRWTRGDWQLLPWIFGRRGHDLPMLGRLKMIDNLRRSLVAPAALLTLISSWAISSAPRGAWLGFVLATLATPSLLTIANGLLPRRLDVSLASHLRRLVEDAFSGIEQTFVALTLLAHHAWLMLDAIGRTLVRLFLTRRRLLEWTTAAQAKAQSKLALKGFVWPLRSATVVVIAASAAVVYLNPSAVWIAAPIIALWWLAPLIARALSLPPEIMREPLSESDTQQLRSIARRTWRFFSTFVTSADHALPPDNFQEDPSPVVAHRSSPTNFGMYLLAIVSARDFGWLGVCEMVDRLRATFATFAQLERNRGHFYNWYDTRDLRPLEPRYVSTVDSGNLVANLLVLKQACLETLERPVLNQATIDGIRDSVSALATALSETRTERLADSPSADEFRIGIEEIERQLELSPRTPRQWQSLIDNLTQTAANLCDLARTFAAERGETENELLAWALLVSADVAACARDTATLFPWARFELPATPAANDVEWHALARELDSNPPLNQLPQHCEAALARVAALRGRRQHDASSVTELDKLARALSEAAPAAAGLSAQLHALAAQAQKIFDETDFGFLFDVKRKLFAIGYLVADGRLDSSYYDLLASEARLASFVAIAKHTVPPEHWFHLGRRLTMHATGPVLLSWSGSMFEYLMPSLALYTPRFSVLDQSCRRAVERQIAYGKQRDVPWGVSESAFYERDRAFTYQYSAFGVPGLGLKRGLEEDLVIAPYATGLAAMYAPRAAVANFARLNALGALGRYGYYEALDFTPTRLPETQRVAFVRAYMAHHQGMLLVALANVIHAGIMRHRLHREPIIQAAELLLEESMPRVVPIRLPRAEHAHVEHLAEPVLPATRRFDYASLATPHAHWLSNGRYAVMLTSAGSGYSTWEKFAVTRWREDATRDAWGSYVYLRDPSNNKIWSAGYQPTAIEPDSYEALLLEDRARITRRDGPFTSVLEVIVSAEDDAEVRRLTLSNNSAREREIELTSYAEIVLAPQAADAAHPAFSKLFVETEYAREVKALLANRRPRASHEPQAWAAHVLALPAIAAASLEYETDRLRFFGRGRDARAPLAVTEGRPLSNTVGAVLDPIFSLRARVRLAPGATVHLVFATMAAASRSEILDLADKYHDPAAFERVSAMAWTHAQIMLHHLRIEPDEALLFQHLASRILFPDAALRASGEFLKATTVSVGGLWRLGISGDRPIVLLRIGADEDTEIARQLIRAHEYWRGKRVAIDLVILNEKPTSYARDLQAELDSLVRGSQARAGQEGRESEGSAYVLRSDALGDEERALVQAAARVVLVAGRGSLAEQALRRARSVATPIARRAWPALPWQDAVAPRVPHLEFFNGLGGFADNGREYVIVLNKGQHTPAPWVNVIANPEFGFLVSEAGATHSWCINSRENQLTPWSNDPVSDPSSEVIFIRDDDSGAIWSPTATPIRIPQAVYCARHGQGYSQFELTAYGIRCDLLQFASWEDPLKVCRLRLVNETRRARRLTVTAYVEWALRAAGSAKPPYLVTELDDATDALFACNPWSVEFGQRIAFVDLAGRQTAWTCDRREFLGRYGSLRQPAALLRSTPLSQRAGAEFDPCAALQTELTLEPGASAEVIFLLGQAENRDSARTLIQRYRSTDIGELFDGVRAKWEDLLTQVQVQTPDRALDLIVNRWLPYQTLVCRFWARAAFYQAGGAYGFRDQLQDCMALMLFAPGLARTHLLHAASRQFVEGDVQHWWHPPSGRGVRTHISDDRLWLPLAVTRYVDVTGDYAVLDEDTSFLEGPQLAPEQEDSYFQPAIAAGGASLYEHCARALEASLARGAHGLPLIGAGDWNDGMNRVGHKGEGESVWLAWFLYETLMEFAGLAETRGDSERAMRWRTHAAELKVAVESAGWDGAWYRRAFFDDGTPLGSAADAECRIDSIAQSWAVLSGAADADRARRAMDAVEHYLIRPGDDLVVLFTPPFDKTARDPGYIKGYLPGVRENGGQYTHAAVWCLMAYAKLGEGDRAWQIFRMLNPIQRAASRAGVYAYKVEPYAVAADIYAEPPHVRRGGWTWYTGSAAWLYRAALEVMLGIKLRANRITFDPCIPREWRSFSVRYRNENARFDIEVQNPHNVTRGVLRLEVNGEQQPGQSMQWRRDGALHRVTVVLG